MRNSVACFVLVLACSLAFSQTKDKATGHFRYTCNTASAFEISLNMSDGKTAVFHFVNHPIKDTIKDPMIASAEVCASGGDCEKAGAEVVFQHVPKMKASGKFTIEYYDGRKEEGLFEATHEKQPKLIICE